MNTNDGGPAFPMSEGDWSGMSLRDWFAGQALMGWAAGRNRPMEHEACEPASVSRSCYTYADAMLRARERGVEVKQGGEYRPHEELPDEHWHKIQTRPSLSWHPERGWEAACEMRGKMMYGKGKTIAQAQAALRAEWEGGGQ